MGLGEEEFLPPAVNTGSIYADEAGQIKNDRLGRGKGITQRRRDRGGEENIEKER